METIPSLFLLIQTNPPIVPPRFYSIADLILSLLLICYYLGMIFQGQILGLTCSGCLPAHDPFLLDSSLHSLAADVQSLPLCASQEYQYRALVGIVDAPA